MPSRKARQIDNSVIPVQLNTVGTYPKIEGSAGWPDNANLDESLVNSLGFEGARALPDYIVKFGVTVERLVLRTRLPVCRECKDARQVRDDNTVAFSLTTL